MEIDHLITKRLKECDLLSICTGEGKYAVAMDESVIKYESSVMNEAC